MAVWISLIIYLLVLKFFMGNLTTDYKKKKYLILSGIAIALIMGMRFPEYPRVYDLKVYYNYYKGLSTIPWNQVLAVDRFEFGYAYLNKILVTIVPWGQFILFFQAGFTTTLFFRYIYLNTPYVFPAVIFYVTLGSLTFNLTAFRQSLAISLLLLSTDFIKSKKIISFIIVVLLAATFHKTAVIFLPFYFIANRRVNWKSNFISFMMLVLSIFFIERLTLIGNALLDTEYSGYQGNTFGGLVPILIYLFVILLTMINPNDKYKVSHNMVVVGLIFYSMRRVTQSMERISFFFSPGLIVQLPNSISMIKDKQVRALLYYVSIIVAIFLFLYRMSGSEYGEYRFFFM